MYCILTSHALGKLAGSQQTHATSACCMYPLKNFGKRERGRIEWSLEGLPNFFGTANYLRSGQSYKQQISYLHQSEEKLIKTSRKV